MRKRITYGIFMLPFYPHLILVIPKRSGLCLMNTHGQRRRYWERRGTMAKTPFKRGDIVELPDGSIYILEEYLPEGGTISLPSWKITTIYEGHQGIHNSQNPYLDVLEDWLEPAKIMGSMETSDAPPSQIPPPESAASPASGKRTSSARGSRSRPSSRPCSARSKR